jgi:hypothetical protein
MQIACELAPIVWVGAWIAASGFIVKGSSRTNRAIGVALVLFGLLSLSFAFGSLCR